MARRADPLGRGNIPRPVPRCMITLETFSGSRKNPVLDSLLQQASTSTDPSTTKTLYQKAMDIAYNEAVDIPLVQGDDLIAMRSNVHGFVYNYLYGSFYYDLYALSKS
jgi:ABC-type transport system substrate-binding protein